MVIPTEKSFLIKYIEGEQCKWNFKFPILVIDGTGKPIKSECFVDNEDGTGVLKITFKNGMIYNIDSNGNYDSYSDKELDGLIPAQPIWR